MISIPEDLEIVIVGNKRKEILTTETLKDIPHRVFYTTDYDLPPDFKIHPQYLKYKSACVYKEGAYRCFRGHQDAINSCTKENILIFEDDAVSENNNWLEILPIAIDMLGEFEVVSLHGRETDLSQFNYRNINGYDFYCKESGKNDIWILGALAYMIKNDFKNKIASQEYVGNPLDLYLATDFDFCFLHPSPFIHDRSKGSLID